MKAICKNCCSHPCFFIRYPMNWKSFYNTLPSRLKARLINSGFINQSPYALLQNNNVTLSFPALKPLAVFKISPNMFYLAFLFSTTQFHRHWILDPGLYEFSSIMCSSLTRNFFASLLSLDASLPLILRLWSLPKNPYSGFVVAFRLLRPFLWQSTMFSSAKSSRCLCCNDCIQDLLSYSFSV